jgi:hypothetical protein
MSFKKAEIIPFLLGTSASPSSKWAADIAPSGALVAKVGRQLLSDRQIEKIFKEHNLKFFNFDTFTSPKLSIRVYFVSKADAEESCAIILKSALGENYDGKVIRVMSYGPSFASTGEMETELQKISPNLTVLTTFKSPVFGQRFILKFPYDDEPKICGERNVLGQKVIIHYAFTCRTCGDLYSNHPETGCTRKCGQCALHGHSQFFPQRCKESPNCHYCQKKGKESSNHTISSCKDRQLLEKVLVDAFPTEFQSKLAKADRQSKSHWKSPFLKKLNPSWFPVLPVSSRPKFSDISNPVVSNLMQLPLAYLTLPTTQIPIHSKCCSMKSSR